MNRCDIGFDESMAGAVVEIESGLAFADATSEWCLESAERSLTRGDLEHCLRYAHLAAVVYSRQNRILFSSQIESFTRAVALQLSDEQGATGGRQQKSLHARPTYLHVLSEALPAGGLTAMAVRWMRNDSVDAIHHVAILNNATVPSAVVDAAVAAGGAIHQPTGLDSFVAQALWLRRLAHDIADRIVLHIDVSDVICGAAFNLPGGPPIVLVNHTAHTFWTGVSYADGIANCRGSDLEGVWAALYRSAAGRCSVVPIPLPEATKHGSSSSALLPKTLDFPEGAVVLVTVGARFKYSPTPSIDFVSLYESMLSELENAYMVVVGFAPDRRWEEAIARSGGKLTLLGTLTPEQVAAVYDVADVYIEGFPFGTTTALLEAALRAVPVVLAPASCPPPYGTDGVAIDGLVSRASSVDDYRKVVAELVRDPHLRRRRGKQVQEAVSTHHTGDGWRLHLKKCVAALPKVHQTYAIEQPSVTPREVYLYWARCVPLWSWSYSETLEHSILRALTLNLSPCIRPQNRRQFQVKRRQLRMRSMPIWLVSVICNFVLPRVPPVARVRFFRIMSFALRPRVLSRVAQLGGGNKGAYDEYRQAPRAGIVGRGT